MSSSSSSLRGKVALVTGASSGIGRATALLFAREGASVVLAARRQAALDAVLDTIVTGGGQAVVLAGDVQDESYAQALVALATQRFGGLDIAFNNAGTLGETRPFPELTRDEFRHTLDGNLTSAFLGARHQIPALVARGGGSLIFTSSFIGHTVGFPGMAAYAAAKAGLVALAQVAAAEFGAKGVRANALLPGGTDTPMAAPLLGTPESRAALSQLFALKRIAAPEEIARAALFLASDASSFVTGTALLADGGVSINRT
jgi:NAD(P)-dependent dehydrogenase (short-subunit alcohol dehydrogenase family)